MEDIVYNKTEKREGNDCTVIENTHIMKVENFYILTDSIMYTGYEGKQGTSASFAYDNLEDAMNHAKACTLDQKRDGRI